MLYTNLKHIETVVDYQQLIIENENVVICCGRMELKCIEVYKIMEKLQKKYRHVAFYDLEFDNPGVKTICNSHHCKGVEGLPYLFYYKNGEAIGITSGPQTKQQIIAVIKNRFEREEIAKAR